MRCLRSLGVLMLLAWPGLASAQSPRLDAYGDPLPPGALLRLGTVRLRPGLPLGHTFKNVYLRPAHFLAFTPDGKSLLSTSSENAIHVWDAATGRPVRRLPFVGEFFSATVAPDGRYVAVESTKGWAVMEMASGKVIIESEYAYAVGFRPEDSSFFAAWPGELHTWSLATGKSTGSVALQEAPECRFANGAASADGTSVAQVGFLRTTEFQLTVWDTATGKLRGGSEPLEHSLRVIGFTPKGKLVIAVHQNKPVAIWDPVTRKQAVRLHVEMRPEESLQPEDVHKWYPICSTSGDQIAVTSRTLAGKIYICDLTTGAVAQTLQSDLSAEVLALAFSPDAKHLALSTGDGAIRIVDVATGIMVGPPGNDASCYAGRVVFARNAGDLFVAKAGGLIEQITTARGTRKRSFWGTEPVAITPDGQTLIVKCDVPELDALHRAEPRYVPGLRAVLLANGKPQWQLPYAEWAGGLVAQNGGQGTWTLLDPVTAKPVDPLPGGAKSGPGRVVAFATEWKLLATKDETKNSLEIWDRSAGKVVCRVPATVAGQEANRFEFAGAGNVLAVVRSFLVTVSEVETFVVLWSIPEAREVLPKTKVEGWWVSPDGGYALLALTDRYELWNLHTAKVVPGWAEPLPPYDVVAFSADGRQLAHTLDEPGTVVVRETATGRELHRFKGHLGHVWHICFSPDSRTLATVGADTTVLLWDLTGRLATEPGVLPAVAADKDTLEKQWARLTGPDASKALWHLVAAGNVSVKWLRIKLEPVKTDAMAAAALLEDLGSSKYAKRVAADEVLRTMEGARPALLQLLAAKPSLEIRLRVERILACLEEPAQNPVLMRQLRAIWVLEQIGTPEARQMLRELADGLPDTHLTRAAQRALARLVPSQTH